jgi:chemotaxis signal transduction protein
MNIFAAQDSPHANEHGNVQDATGHVVLPRTLGFAAETEDERERRDLILMRLRSGRAVAVFADEAETVVARPRATPLPGAPAAICGVVSVRGRMYTLVDLDQLFEEMKQEKAARRAHTEQIEDDSMVVALRGDEQLALSVARVERIVAVPTDSLVKLARHAPFLRGVTEHDKRLIMVLDPAKIFASAAPLDEDDKKRADPAR